jgi:PiT family inorganic phosphate transporter
MEVLLLAAAIAVAFANGANDNAKGVATLLGAGILGRRGAIAWATLTTLAGSLAAVLLAGALVRRFTGKGLVPEIVVVDPAFLAAVAAGAAATVLVATGFGVPISTTHALTGALVGSGMALAGPASVSYATLGTGFVAPLLLSPLLSLSIAAVGYPFFRRLRLLLGVSEEKCVCVDPAPDLAVAGAGTRASMARLRVSVCEACERPRGRPGLRIETLPVLNGIHCLSAGAVGFARGLNDTPKIAALLALGNLAGAPAIALVAGAMAVGGLLATRRVATTMAWRITGMNEGQAASASFVTAALVAVASSLGLPVSTTHVSCGALFGIGAVTGEARWRTIGGIFTAWVVTLPLAAALAAAVALWLGSR